MNYQTLMEMAPLPKVEDFKKVLFIGPHPDDIEISSGALVKKLVDKGAEVHFLVVTDGGAGSNDPNQTIEQIKAIRKQESYNAGKVLGVNSVEVLDFPDAGIYSVEEMTVAIARKIQALLPDTVFTPDPLLPTETHPDHINCAKATNEALVIAKFRFAAIRHGIDVKKDQVLPRGINLMYYYTHRPNIIVPITKEEFDVKIASILKHESQMDESFAGMKMYLYYKASSLGQEVGSEYGEGYFGMSPVHQHCFTENI